LRGPNWRRGRKVAWVFPILDGSGLRYFEASSFLGT
jgi:hypothetical protein